VFKRAKLAIFVHGCFWHSHKGCRRARKPSTKLDYWLPKLSRNADRDAAVTAALEGIGWRTLTVWECEIATGDGLRKIVNAVADWVRGPSG
jgi:DNA mismatch endonuclease (patch repair protein)